MVHWFPDPPLGAKVVDVVHFVVFAAFKEDMDYLTQLIADHVRTPVRHRSLWMSGVSVVILHGSGRSSDLESTGNVFRVNALNLELIIFTT